MLSKSPSTASLALTSFAVAAATAGLESAIGKPRNGLALVSAERESVARGLDYGSALLAAAALADSAVEHYRGSFHNRTMMLPLAVAGQAVSAGLHGALDGARGFSATRDTGHAASVVTGLAGFGFHLYNILKRPGGWSWLNLFYAAPVGAPVALTLAGVLGGLAERLRSGGRAVVYGVLPGRFIARLVAAGLLGTSVEAGLLHFRGAYHNPAMLIPVTAPPAAAALLAAAAVSPRWEGPARFALRLLTAIGLAGAGFHAYGVSRNMGGWHNWSQNILNGPPLPAPPAFTALAIAGLAALKLLERER